MEELLEKVNALEGEDLWLLSAKIRQLLKEKKYIRTRNATGERGESLVFKIYNETKGLAKLQPAPENTKNVDALSREGKLYAIKTISGKTVNTGVFGGLMVKKGEEPERAFDFLVIVILDTNLQADLIVEMTWEQFLKHKRWYTGMLGYNVTVGKKLFADAKVIFDSGHDRSNGWRQHLYLDKS